MKKSDIIRDDRIENRRKKPFDHNEETKPQRSKWFRWLRVIIDFIVDVFS